jgi:hypothetical protein
VNETVSSSARSERFPVSWCSSRVFFQVFFQRLLRCPVFVFPSCSRPPLAVVHEHGHTRKLRVSSPTV